MAGGSLFLALLVAVFCALAPMSEAAIDCPNDANPPLCTLTGPTRVRASSTVSFTITVGGGGGTVACGSSAAYYSTSPCTIGNTCPGTSIGNCATSGSTQTYSAAVSATGTYSICYDASPGSPASCEGDPSRWTSSYTDYLTVFTATLGSISPGARTVAGMVTVTETYTPAAAASTSDGLYLRASGTACPATLVTGMTNLPATATAGQFQDTVTTTGSYRVCLYDGTTVGTSTLINDAGDGSLVVVAVSALTITSDGATNARVRAGQSASFAFTVTPSTGSGSDTAVITTGTCNSVLPVGGSPTSLTGTSPTFTLSSPSGGAYRVCYYLGNSNGAVRAYDSGSTNFVVVSASSVALTPSTNPSARYESDQTVTFTFTGSQLSTADTAFVTTAGSCSDPRGSSPGTALTNTGAGTYTGSATAGNYRVCIYLESGTSTGTLARRLYDAGASSYQSVSVASATLSPATRQATSSSPLSIVFSGSNLVSADGGLFASSTCPATYSSSLTSLGSHTPAGTFATATAPSSAGTYLTCYYTGTVNSASRLVFTGPSYNIIAVGAPSPSRVWTSTAVGSSSGSLTNADRLGFDTSSCTTTPSINGLGSGSPATLSSPGTANTYKFCARISDAGNYVDTGNVVVLADPTLQTPSNARIGAGQSVTVQTPSGPSLSSSSDEVSEGSGSCPGGSTNNAPTISTWTGGNRMCVQAGSVGAWKSITMTPVTASSPSQSTRAASASNTITFDSIPNGDGTQDRVELQSGTCSGAPSAGSANGDASETFSLSNPITGGTYQVCYYVNARNGAFSAGQLNIARATGYTPSSVAINQATTVTINGANLANTDRIRICGPATTPDCSSTQVLSVLATGSGSSVTFDFSPTALGNYAVCYSVLPGGTEERLAGVLVGSNVQGFAPSRLASSGSAFTFTVSGGSLGTSDKVQLFTDASGCTTSSGGSVTADATSNDTVTYFKFNSGFTAATGTLGLCYQAGGTGAFLRIGSLVIPNPTGLAPTRFMDGVGFALTVSGTNLDGDLDQISLRLAGACSDTESAAISGSGSGASVVFPVAAAQSTAGSSRAICYRVQTDPARLDSVSTITIANVTALTAPASIARNTSTTLSVTGTNINPTANSDQVFLVATGAGCTSTAVAGPFNSSDTTGGSIDFAVTSPKGGAFDVCFAVRGAADATKLVPGTPVIVNCTLKTDCFLATDACIASQCGPCTSNADCDDGDLCNGLEICDTGSGQCQSPTPLNCTTDDACIDGQCVQSAGGCVNTTLCVCGDGYTQLSETCDPGNDTATGAANVVPGCVDCRRQSGYKCTNNVDPATPSASQCSRTKKKSSSSSFPAAAVAVPIAVVACCCCLILLIIVIAVLIFLCVKFGLFGKAASGAKTAAGKVKMPKMPKRGGGGGGGSGGAGGVEVEWDDEL